MKSVIREPKQERSIEKKNKIIQSGYELFSEVGYHATNTVEIAKRAGVSTGIVYGYFQDKRDILICALKIYIDKISHPIINLLKKVNNPADLNKVARDVLDETIKIHQNNAKMHNTLHSLTATDEEVKKAFIDLEDSLTNQISDELIRLGVKKNDIVEKTHMAINLAQSFAHEYVFDNHNYINYPSMKNIVCNLLVGLFTF